jgi:hypothetical protein
MVAFRSRESSWNRTSSFPHVMQASSQLDHGIVSVSELREVRRDGVEPPEPEDGWITATGACQCPTDACCSSSTGGSRTHKRSRRFELRRFTGLRTVLLCRASPMGFEPTISCVTGRRALRTAPRGRNFDSVAQVGFEPTASLVLNQGGLPVAYRAKWLRVEYPEQDSNLQTSGFKPDRSAVGVPGRCHE